MCELIKIKKIIETADYDKRNIPINRENLLYRPISELLDDYMELHAVVWDIQRVFADMERGE